MSIVKAQHLQKDYVSGETTVNAIRGIDFSIEPASFVSFVGSSGSGKSTLLNMIGCLDPPTGGSLEVAGRDIARLSRTESVSFRGEYHECDGYGCL